MRALLTSLTFAALLAACGPRGGAKGPSGSADVGAYAALRWVPADATYVITTRSVEDAAAVLREMVNVVGILADGDADLFAASMRRGVGFDVLSGNSLAEIGVDRTGGAAIFSQGLSPTVAVKLSDPARLAETIDRLRTGGVAVQVERRGGIEIFSYGDDEATLHWAIADGWLWLHLGFSAEHEADGAWFDALRSAGGAIAAQPDWKAALAAAGRRVRGFTVAPDGPPVVGLVRVPPIVDRVIDLGIPSPCLGPARRAKRVFVAMGVVGADTAGAITVDLGDAAADVAARILGAMPGWGNARSNAPIQAEWSYDLAALAEAMRPCDGGDLAREQAEPGLRTFRLFLHTIDIDKMSARGALHVDLNHRRAVSAVLDEIPARRMVERPVKIGPFNGAAVRVPILPPFSYVLTDTLFIAGVDLDLAAVVGAGTPIASGSLGHLELRPNALPASTWDTLLERVRGGEESRRRMVKRLQRWDLGRLGLDLDGAELVFTAHGQLHR